MTAAEQAGTTSARLAEALDACTALSMEVAALTVRLERALRSNTALTQACNAALAERDLAKAELVSANVELEKLRAELAEAGRG
jgi:hypothetical protein